MNSIKERDKSYKRKSYVNRSRHVETMAVEHSSEGKEFFLLMKVRQVIY